MTHGSLFSGIGGFDLAAEWMGWTNVFHCEWNPFGQKVLKHYWPDAISYTDITKTDFSKHYGTIDIISGGFPCQPYSTAGKRLGKEDERHLWPEMLRAIREIKPRYVVGENVSGLITWNGGMVFDEVQADLEAEGFAVIPFILPACGVNAPHRRDRVWFIAHAIDRRSQNGRPESNSGLFGQSQQRDADTNYKPAATKPGFVYGAGGVTSDTQCGRRVQVHNDLQREKPNGVGSDAFDDPTYWTTWPTVAPLCTGNDGIPTGLDTTALSFSKWRAESVKAAGNAIVPQVAYQIFKAIEQYENQRTQNCAG